MSLQKAHEAESTSIEALRVEKEEQRKALEQVHPPRSVESLVAKRKHSADERD